MYKLSSVHPWYRLIFCRDWVNEYDDVTRGSAESDVIIYFHPVETKYQAIPWMDGAVTYIWHDQSKENLSWDVETNHWKFTMGNQPKPKSCRTIFCFSLGKASFVQFRKRHHEFIHPAETKKTNSMDENV
ncbi:hypothetical protein V1264_009942 [Littorina saxatilis]|uniref:Uncharacterized protein n=1 Tax=Littorina saxatilis TaxID=31220 RepID=A0AAN9ANC8_9CAEN